MSVELDVDSSQGDFLHDLQLMFYGANSGQKIDTTVGRSPNDRPMRFCVRRMLSGEFLTDRLTGSLICTDRPTIFCIKGTTTCMSSAVHVCKGEYILPV